MPRRDARPFLLQAARVCPSSSAKRASELAAVLVDHVLEDAKTLRPLFFRRRELRGRLARLAWETVRDLMAAAASGPDLRPGMVRLSRATATGSTLTLTFTPWCRGEVGHGTIASSPSRTTRPTTPCWRVRLTGRDVFGRAGSPKMPSRAPHRRRSRKCAGRLRSTCSHRMALRVQCRSVPCRLRVRRGELSPYACPDAWPKTDRLSLVPFGPRTARLRGCRSQSTARAPAEGKGACSR
jgi:hypothetical protein